MPVDIRTTYNTWLMSAQEAVKRRDRAAALYCLKQAMACANRTRDTRYRSAVLRAMNVTRSI